MNPAALIIIFVLVWWCAFFALLPIGVRGRWESGADGVEGADPGAPADPQLKKKALQATLVSAVLTACITLVIMSGVISFGE
jgi:predicted secreted protein